MTPLISVIMPTRDRADLLLRAVDSVRHQTLGDWELIIIDDGSTDATGEQLRAVAMREPRIRVLRNESGAGAAAARNRGVAQARGRFVAFLDDDDEWLPCKLELQSAVLEAAPSSIGLVHSPFHEVRADGRTELRGAFAAASGSEREVLLRGNYISMCTVLVRRQLLVDAGGFDERLPRLQDWDLWLRLAAITRFTHEATVSTRVHVTAGSISRDADALRVACGAMLRKYADRSDHARAELSFALGHALFTQGLCAEGRALMRQALRLRPVRAKRLLLVAVAHVSAHLYAAIGHAHLAVVQRHGRRAALALQGAARVPTRPTAVAGREVG